VKLSGGRLVLSSRKRRIEPMKQQIHRISIVFLAALVIAGAASASNLWFHVRVDEAEGAKVTVNLPVSMIEKAISMIPEEHLSDHGIHFSEHDWRRRVRTSRSGRRAGFSTSPWSRKRRTRRSMCGSRLP
jgi:hypothetical protein